MRVLLNRKEMKACDKTTIETFGVPSVVLMERAALSCADALYHSTACLDKIVVVCGSGNNGGDGFAVARLLHLDGYDVTISFLGKESHMTKECAMQKKICENYGVKFCDMPDYSEYTVIVDAVFGIGLSRIVTDDYEKVFKQINQAKAYILAVDLPSGIDADTGAILGCAIKADITVTFGFEKPGLYLSDGRACAGTVIRSDMGITKESLQESAPVHFCYEDSDLLKLPKTERTANKGTCGKVLLIAGSTEMCGAAVLAARAAFACGAGLVRVYTDACNRDVILQCLPEAIVTVQKAECWRKQLDELLFWADACAIGPGLGSSEDKAEIVHYCIRNYSGPLIMDADALNIHAKQKFDLTSRSGNLMITPHLGEMARICRRSINEIRNSLPNTAAAYALENRTICVLKDAGSVVSDGRQIYINTSGNSGMATGGAGDVLTGILACLAAQKMNLFEAGCLGVWLHGLAGDVAAAALGRRSMKAGDIVSSISEILWKVQGDEDE